MVLNSQSLKKSTGKISNEHSTIIKAVSPKTKRKRASDIDTAVDLSKYRNGNLEDPGLCISALVKNFFLEMNVTTATINEIYQYVEKIQFYGMQNETEIKKWTHAIVSTMNVDSNSYRNEKFGTWTYIKSPAFNSFATEKEEAKIHEDREYVSQIFAPDKDFTWIGNNFELCGYKFFYRRKLKTEYAICVQCNLLYQRAKAWNLKTLKKIKIPKIGILKIRKDGSVEGCPWKPSEYEHFCLQDGELRSAMKKDAKIITFQQRLERIPKLCKELEEFYETSFSAQFNLDNIEFKLKFFIEELNGIFSCSFSQRHAFLYFLRYSDSPTITYFGITYDYCTRFNDHLANDKKYGRVRNREMIIAPLGQKNKLFLKVLEALLIRMSKENLLNNATAEENTSLGDFTTENMIYKDTDNKFKEDIIKAMNQLISLTLKYGEVITKSEAERSKIWSLSQKIRYTRHRCSKNSFQHLILFHDSIDNLSVTDFASSSIDICITPAELSLFLCETEAIHKYTSTQIPAYLYFLKYPNNSAVKRYGVTKDPQKRFDKHEKKVKLGNDIEMIIAPLGERNALFIEDLEALLIRFSKMKLLNDGKSNENEDGDVGNIHTKYEVFQAIVDQENHPRRPFLIKALNQLIELTLSSNIKVESLKK